MQNNNLRDVERESSAQLGRQSGRNLTRRCEVGRNDFVLQTFTLPVAAARRKVRDILDRVTDSGHLETVENWQQLVDGKIRFTMRRWPALD